MDRSEIEKTRFKYDICSICDDNHDYAMDCDFREYLQISPAISDSIYSIISSINEQIDIIEEIVLYIKPSTENNSYVIRSGKNSCKIFITSSLIKLLTVEEIRFVLAHEIAHIIFNHDRTGLSRFDERKRNFIKRTQEITADRFAMLFLEDTRRAYTTMLKIITGLDDEYINLNIKDFLFQFRKQTTQSYESEHIFSTHPSTAIRMRALNLFEMSQKYYDLKFNKRKAPLSDKKLEEKIFSDLVKIDSAALHKREKELTNKIILLYIFMNITHKESLYRTIEELTEQFNKKTVEQVYCFYKDNSQEKLYSKLDELRAEIYPIVTLNDVEFEAVLEMAENYVDEPSFRRLLLELRL